MAVKATPVKIQPGTKMDRTWSKIHTDYVGPMNGIYYLIVVDSFTKWPEVVKYRRSHVQKHKIFTRFGVPDAIVSDNGTQFMAKEF